VFSNPNYLGWSVQEESGHADGRFDAAELTEFLNRPENRDKVFHVDTVFVYPVLTPRRD
jgi:hypothetical protein